MSGQEIQEKIRHRLLKIEEIRASMTELEVCKPHVNGRGVWRNLYVHLSSLHIVLPAVLDFVDLFLSNFPNI